jgi:hypothetical protein
MGFIDRLPGPFWLAYIILFLLQSTLNMLLAWQDGFLPVSKIEPLLFLYPFWLWIPLALVTHLNNVAGEALANFRPLLKMDDEAFKRLEYEFTTMPSRGVILSGIVWGILYVILNLIALPDVQVVYGWKDWLTGVVFLEGLISYLFGSVIYYHAIRQLWLVDRTVKLVKQFNLFHLDPIYAFSRLTSQTGISWVILLTFTLLVFPLRFASLLPLATMGFQVALALAAFVVPIWSVHRKLVSEKRRLQAELNQRVEATFQRLHRCLDENRLDEVDGLNSAMSGLSSEREVLAGIPTFPWRAGTLTGFLSAVALPVALFLVQLVIERWLGG